MRALLVRAGLDNELVDVFLRSGAAFVGWGRLGDLAGSTARGIESALVKRYPEGMTVGGAPKKHYREIVEFAFAERGDVVATPHRAARRILVGTVTDGYRFYPDSSIRSGGEPYRHALEVNWTHAVSRVDLSDHVLRDTDQRGKTTFWLRPETAEEILAAPRLPLLWP